MIAKINTSTGVTEVKISAKEIVANVDLIKSAVYDLILYRALDTSVSNKALRIFILQMAQKTGTSVINIAEHLPR